MVLFLMKTGLFLALHPGHGLYVSESQLIATRHQENVSMKGAETDDGKQHA